MANTKTKILHVEDRESIIGAFKISFQDKNKFNFKCATNLEDALSIIQKEDFDVYVTDGSYPLNKSGREDYAWPKFYENLMKIKPDAKVILLSANEFSSIPKNITYFNKTDLDKCVKYIEGMFK